MLLSIGEASQGQNFLNEGNISTWPNELKRIQQIMGLQRRQAIVKYQKLLDDLDKEVGLDGSQFEKLNIAVKLETRRQDKNYEHLESELTSILEEGPLDVERLQVRFMARLNEVSVKGETDDSLFVKLLDSSLTDVQKQKFEKSRHRGAISQLASSAGLNEEQREALAELLLKEKTRVPFWNYSICFIKLAEIETSKLREVITSDQMYLAEPYLKKLRVEYASEIKR